MVNKGFIHFFNEQYKKSKRIFVKKAQKTNHKIYPIFLKSIEEIAPQQYLMYIFMKHFPTSENDDKTICLEILNLLCGYSKKIEIVKLSDAIRDYLKGNHSGLMKLNCKDYVVVVDKLEQNLKSIFYSSVGELNFTLGNISRKKGDVNEAIKFYNCALELFNLAENKELKANCLHQKGILYKNIGEFQKSLDLYDVALKSFKEIGNENGIANVLGNEGVIHSILGDFDLALDFFNSALKLHKKNNNQKGIASAFNNIGLVYSKKGNLQKALEFHNNALKLNNEMGDKEKEAITLGNIGNVYQNQGNYLIAQEYYNSALISQNELIDKSIVATLFGNLGNIFRIKGEINTALEYYYKSLDVFKTISNSLGEAKTYDCLSITFREKGDLNKALDFCDKSSKINKSIGNKEGIANTCILFGNIYKEKGDFKKALDYYNGALIIFRNSGLKYGETSTLNNIGLVYEAEGKLDVALDFFNQALEINKICGYVLEISKTLTNIGSIHKFKGNFEQALNFYMKSLDLCKKMGNLNGQAAANKGLGDAYQIFGENEGALKFYSESLRLYEQIDSKINIAHVLTSIGNIYHKKGDADKSIELHSKSLQLYRQLNLKNGEAIALQNIGISCQDNALKLKLLNQSLNLYKQLNNKHGEVGTLNDIGVFHLIDKKFEVAIGYFESALKIIDNEEIREDKFKTYLNISNAKEKLGEIEECLNYVEKAIEEIEYLRENSTILNNRKIFSEYYLTVYVQAISASLKLPDETRLERTFGYIEKTKGRTLLDILFKRIEKIEGQGETTFKIKGAFTGLSFSEAIEISKGKTILEYFIFGDNLLIFIFKDGNIYFRKIELNIIENLENIFFEIQDFILNQSKIIGDIYRKNRATKEDIYIGADILNSNIKNEKTPITYLINLIYILNLFIENGITNYVEDLKKILYTIFISNIEDIIDDSNEIYIIPHIYLHLLPFHVLYDAEKDMHLIEKHVIKYLPNFAILKIFTENTQIKTFLGVGIKKHDDYPDLEYVHDEVKYACEVLGVKAKLLIDEIDAPICKENVIRELSNFDLIHFATHGYYDENNPLNCKIILSNDDLAVHEIMALKKNLKRKNIILNLCESGKSVISSGDEAFSLPISFAKLGCSSVIANLFGIDDMFGYEFMQDFYKNLKLNGNLAMALQKTQAELSKKYSTELSRWASYYYFGI